MLTVLLTSLVVVEVLLDLQALQVGSRSE